MLELDVLREEYGRAYQKGYPATVRFLASRGLPTETAHELAQAAWVRGWQYRDQLRDTALLLTWVNSIALNLQKRFLRNEQRFLAISEAPFVPSIEHFSLDVAQVLGECKPLDRVILKQFHLEERPIREIAREHRCSVTAMRIRLVRARRFARSQIRRATRANRPHPVAMRLLTEPCQASAQ